MTAAKTESWVPLKRKLFNSAAFYAGPYPWYLFTWLLARARFVDGEIDTKYGKRFLKRGQVFIGCGQIESELSTPGNKFTRATYRSTINRLVARQLIAVEPTKKGTKVTIRSYDDLTRISGKSFQQFDHAHSQALTIEEPEVDQASALGPTTNNNGDRELAEDREIENERKRGCRATHASLLSQISLGWKEIVGNPLIWTSARERQVDRVLMDKTPAQLLEALDKFKKIRSHPDQHNPRTWTFEQFFTHKSLDEVLDQPIEHFLKFKNSSRRGASSLSDAVTPNSAYNGAARSHHEEEE